MLNVQNATVNYWQCIPAVAVPWLCCWRLASLSRSSSSTAILVPLSAPPLSLPLPLPRNLPRPLPLPLALPRPLALTLLLEVVVVAGTPTLGDWLQRQNHFHHQKCSPKAKENRKTIPDNSCLARLAYAYIRLVSNMATAVGSLDLDQCKLWVNSFYRSLTVTEAG